MELEALNDRILQSMGSGLITLDQEGRILSFNKAAGKILGYSFGEIRQRPLAEAIPQLADHGQLTGPPFEYDGINSRRELAVKNKEGKRLSLGFSVSPLTTTEGKAVGKIMIFQDITEVKKMQERVKKLERLAMMGTLAAGMAHEIKNPLGSISGAFQMLHTEEKGSSVSSRLTAIIEREIARLNELLNEFLWLSKPVKKEGTFKEVALSTLIDDTITLACTKFQVDGRVEFERTIPADFNLFVDESQFRQVVWNLVLNALEAMEYQGAIRIDAEKVVLLTDEAGEKPFSRVTFHDTGKGIPPDILDQIYEPFFTTKEKGTGLGLAVVQQIVESHCGSIQVESSDDAGTVFSLYLPDSHEIEIDSSFNPLPEA
jgi:two-component system sensor histidine kinase PilS (NtrC family)